MGLGHPPLEQCKHDSIMDLYNPVVSPLMLFVGYREIPVSGNLKGFIGYSL